MAILKLYTMKESTPGRIVQMTLSILNLKHQIIIVDPRKGENHSPDYLKLNPQHTVPTLVDGDFVLNESRAICIYLISTYGSENNSNLYPVEDVVLKAKIDQRLYFDMGTFFSAVQEDYLAVLLGGAKSVSKQTMDKYEEILPWVTGFVKSGYAAGTKHMTLADLSLISTYSTLKEMKCVDLRKYPFLESWFQRCKTQIPDYDRVNGEGAELMGTWYRKAKAANNNQ